MKRILLNGTWHLSGGKFDCYGNIPGSLFSFLIDDNKLIPDPYYRDNEKKVRDLAKNDVRFTAEFSVSDELLAKKNLSLDMEDMIRVFLDDELSEFFYYRENGEWKYIRGTGFQGRPMSLNYEAINVSTNLRINAKKFFEKIGYKVNDIELNFEYIGYDE